MKVALRLRILPGSTIRDKQKWAFDHGVDAIELSAWDYGPDDLTRARKDFQDSLVPVCGISDNPTDDLLDPLPEKRRRCIGYIKSYLQLAGDLGAVGHTVVPILGPPRLHDLLPWRDAVTMEKCLLVELCKEIGDVAAACGTFFLLKPSNHYEQHLLCSLADGAEIIKQCKHERVGLTGDFFHMYIEEQDIPEAIRANAAYLKHVHLADNTGLQPGTGDLDFVSAFQALMEIGFSGYMVIHCSISGEDKSASLVKSLAFVREMIDTARRSVLQQKGGMGDEDRLAVKSGAGKYCG